MSDTAKFPPQHAPPHAGPGGTSLSGNAAPAAGPSAALTAATIRQRKSDSREAEAIAALKKAPSAVIAALPAVAAALQAARGQGARGFLHVYCGPNFGQTLMLGQAAIAIGRGETSTLLLSGDVRVSRKHCEVRPAGAGWQVADQ